MPERELYNTRLPNDVADTVDQYSEERGVSKSEALRRLICKGLESEREREPIPDGGRITRREHPWVEPLIDIADRAALGGVFLLILGMFPVSVTSGAIGWFGAEVSTDTAALAGSLFLHFAIIGTIFVSVSAIAIGALQMLMHPTEAPITRHLPRLWPEEYRTEAHK